MTSFHPVSITTTPFTLCYMVHYCEKELHHLQLIQNAALHSNLKEHMVPLFSLFYLTPYALWT